MAVNTKNSIDHRLRAGSTEVFESIYACDCGQEYMNEDSLERHQQTNCKNRLIQCSFCQETVPSTTALRDHLLLCGNKTDQCPNCRQFIRRSHFAYHYENNCASVDDVETPPTRPRNQLVHRTPTNPNKPFSREDVISDDYRENYTGQQTSVYPPRTNGRIQSPISNIRNSPVVIECDYCHSRCAQSDYQTHKDNCLRNPANINNRQPPPRIPLGSNQSQGRSPVNGHSSPNGIVHIPCEYCNEQVDLPNWSNHTQNCRERETRRLATLARTKSEEPVNEQLPCEHCQHLFTAERLHAHENNCPRNPDHMAYAANLARGRPAQRVLLPIKSSKNNRNPSPSSNVRALQNPRVVYQSIDVDRTHEANRSSDNDISINHVNTHRHPMRRTASDEIPLQSGNSPRRVHGYDNVPLRLNEHRSNENMPLLNKQGGRRAVPPIPGSPYGTSQRSGSPYDDLHDIREHQDSSRPIANRSPYYNDSEHQHRLHGNHKNYVVIDNQPGQHISNKPKKESWIKKFFCGPDSGHSSS